MVNQNNNGSGSSKSGTTPAADKKPETQPKTDTGNVVRYRSRYPRLRINVQSPTLDYGPNNMARITKKGWFVQFENHEYETSDPKIIKLLNERAKSSNKFYRIRRNAKAG